jgi:hypothetical protein
MANNFEIHVSKFENWLHEDHRREDNFFNLPDIKEGETLREYFSRNAYLPDIIQETVGRLMTLEKERAIEYIFSK